MCHLLTVLLALKFIFQSLFFSFYIVFLLCTKISWILLHERCDIYFRNMNIMMQYCKEVKRLQPRSAMLKLILQIFLEFLANRSILLARNKGFVKRGRGGLSWGDHHKLEVFAVVWSNKLFFGTILLYCNFFVYEVAWLLGGGLQPPYLPPHCHWLRPSYIVVGVFYMILPL